jgi:hypothetical protein
MERPHDPRDDFKPRPPPAGRDWLLRGFGLPRCMCPRCLPPAEEPKAVINDEVSTAIPVLADTAAQSEPELEPIG